MNDSSTENNNTSFLMQTVQKKSKMQFASPRVNSFKNNLSLNSPDDKSFTSNDLGITKARSNEKNNE